MGTLRHLCLLFLIGPASLLFTPQAPAAPAGSCAPSLIGHSDLEAIAYSRDLGEVSPAIVYSDLEHAIAIRFGNTRSEVESAAWRDYSNRLLWFVPGIQRNVLRVIYAQVRGDDGGLVRLQIPVKLCGDPEQAIHFPPIFNPDPRSGGLLLHQSFDDWAERWVSYMDSYGIGNVFYPLTHHDSGGADGGGYISVDDSRWNIDPPEDPDSTLFALIYYRWLFSPGWPKQEVDLRGAELSVQLRDKLEPSGLKITFWALCDGARFHFMGSLLRSGHDWTGNRLVLKDDPSLWHRSWARGGAEVPLCLDRVESFGFSLHGFPTGEKPRGHIDIDEMMIREGPADDAK